MSITSCRSSEHLLGLCALLNSHVAAIVPGWAVTPDFLHERLGDNPDQPVLNPWVIERATFCAVERGTVVAAVHLPRYGKGPEVSTDYHDIAEIAWSIHSPDHHAAGVAVLHRACELMRAWGVRERVASFDLAGIINGVPDRWPHVAAALRDAGFQPAVGEGSRDELRHGPIPAVTPDPQPPLPGLRIRERTGDKDTRLAALHVDREVGYCESRHDLTRDASLPALAQWAEVSDLWVAEAWRGRGIGTWLLTHTCAALAARGRTRVVLLAEDDDQGRPGHLYDRFGWPVAATYDKLWREVTAEA